MIYKILEFKLISFRTQRVIFMTPFYMLFEFLLFKYIFMLFYPLDDLTLLVLIIIVGLLNIAPMLAKRKKQDSLRGF